MSAFLEYLKLIPKAVKDGDKIVEGQINLVKMKFGTLPEDEQNEIIRRRVICSVCPFSSSNAAANPAINYKTDRFDEHCIHCGCTLDRKTAALSEKCGLEIYNKKHPNEQIPLKWDVYKKEQNDNKTN
jgi:hypothetical protein